MPTIEDLRYMQKLPLDIKIAMTKLRISKFINRYGSECYVSFSGGKDSTVLLHIARQLYPNLSAVFVNTGLEYPEIQAFVRSHDNITVITPQYRFTDIISEYGYPVIGKEIARAVHYARQGSSWAIDKLTGKKKNADGTKSKYNYTKYEPLLHTDFDVAEHCCYFLKKRPAHNVKMKCKYSIIGTLAEESHLRTQRWLKTGCNSYSGNIKSRPMSFWTEQDILEYIRQYNLPIASVYGDIVTDRNTNELCTTGCNRTGCIYCGFGCHLEQGETRFQKLAKTHPRHYEYCLGGGEYTAQGKWQPNHSGLGLAHVFDTLNDIYGKDFIRYE